MWAAPTIAIAIVGFKLVIPRSLGPHGIYDLPSRAWYNYNMCMQFI